MIIAAVVLLLAAAGVYLFAPGTVYALAVAGERARAGLRRDVVRAGNHDIALLRSAESGDGTRETVVMLHGFGADSYHWPRMVRALQRAGGPLRIIAPDLPGFGESSCDGDADYGVDAQVHRLHELFEHLQLDTFHLIGSSMGGHLAALYLCRHPQRVRSLTLIDAAGVTPRRPTEFTRALDEEGRNLLLTESREDFRRVTDLVFSQPPVVPPRVMDYLGDRSAQRRDRYARLFEQYLRDARPLELGPPLPDVPALVIWGAEDRVVPPQDGEVFASLLPRAELVVLADTGHLPMLEVPERVAALCSQLFARTRDAEAAPEVAGSAAQASPTRDAT